MHPPAFFVPIGPDALVPFCGHPRRFDAHFVTRRTSFVIGAGAQEMMEWSGEYGGDLLGVEAGDQRVFYCGDGFVCGPVV